MEYKYCRKCGNHKKINNFYKNRNSPDGYHAYCKYCQRAYSQHHKHIPIGAKLPFHINSAIKNPSFREQKAGPVIHIPVEIYLKEKKK